MTSTQIETISQKIKNRTNLSQDFYTKLQREAEEGAHKRKQQVENAIANLKVWGLYFTFVLFIILVVSWPVSCYLNAYQVKSGIEMTGLSLINIFIGAVLSKCL